LTFSSKEAAALKAVFLFAAKKSPALRRGIRSLFSSVDRADTSASAAPV